MNIQIINESGYPLPEYATAGSAGFDLRAAIDEPVTLYPGKRVLISTGLKVAMPQGIEMQIRSRSGLAAKWGVIVLNEPGTIDSDFRNTIHVILFNTGEAPFVINPGERIAQGVIAKHEIADWEPVETLDETKRGLGGFGSTGLK